MVSTIADDLMPRRDWQAMGRHVALTQLQVGAAHRARLHAQRQLAWRWLLLVKITKYERSFGNRRWPLQSHRAHSEAPFLAWSISLAPLFIIVAAWADRQGQANHSPERLCGMTQSDRCCGPCSCYALCVWALHSMVSMRSYCSGNTRLRGYRFGGTNERRHSESQKNAASSCWPYRAFCRATSHYAAVIQT